MFNQTFGNNASQDTRDVEFVSHIIKEAEHQADLVGRFLLDHGFRPSTASATSEPLSEQTSTALRVFLLELGASLRLAEWESAGVANEVAGSLPSAKRAITEAADRLVSATTVSLTDRPVSREVFRIHRMRFARHGPRFVDADIILPERLEIEHLTDAIADFLFQLENQNEFD